MTSEQTDGKCPRCGSPDWVLRETGEHFCNWCHFTLASDEDGKPRPFPEDPDDDAYAPTDPAPPIDSRGGDEVGGSDASRNWE